MDTKGSVDEQIEKILGTPEVDAAVDCVGFEAKGVDTTIKSAASFERFARDQKQGVLVFPVCMSPKIRSNGRCRGNRKLSMRLGLGWAKSLSFATGQCPTLKYNSDECVLDRVQIDKAENVEVISLDDAPRGYADFDKG